MTGTARCIAAGVVCDCGNGVGEISRSRKSLKHLAVAPAFLCRGHGTCLFILLGVINRDAET
jgi:hypothetical protein